MDCFLRLPMEKNLFPVEVEISAMVHLIQLRSVRFPIRHRKAMVPLLHEPVGHLADHYPAAGTIGDAYAVNAVEFGINSYGSGDVNNLAFGSVHSGGSQYAFADGSTRYINQRIKLDIVKTLCSIGSLEMPEKIEE